jgi:hypothetical protein
MTTPLLPRNGIAVLVKGSDPELPKINWHIALVQLCAERLGDEVFPKLP